MRNPLYFRCIVLYSFVLTAVSPPSVSVAACLSTASGLWSHAATWQDCNGTIPQASDSAFIQNAHTIILDIDIPNVAVTIDSGGVLAVASNHSFGGSTVAVSGSLRLDSGAVVQNATFTYNSGSTLHYNSGGTYTRGDEWSSGDPHHVQISNNTTFDLSTTTEQTMLGDLLIDNGSTFLMGSTNADLIVQGNVNIQGALQLATGTGNLQVGGDWTKAATGADPYKFKHNDSWVIFNGNKTQTIDGAMNGTKDRFARIVVTNNSDVIYSNKIGVVTGLEVTAGSSFAPATNEKFEQELNSLGVLSCAGTCIFNRLTIRRLDAAGATGIVDVNENFVIQNQTSMFVAPPAGTPFTIAGDFSSANTSGTIDFNGGTVQFDGGTMQTISGVGINAFHNLVVTTGTTLVDEADTAVTASGTFTNDGIFRRAEQLTAVGSQDFGLTNVTMPVNSVTGSPTITVDRIDSDHPGTTAAIAANSERYWAITADAGGTFNVDVIFDDDTLAANTVQRTCRTDDSGANWDCVLDADPATNITRRNGVTDFSEWQNCAACGPTAISLDSVSLTPAPVAKWTWLSLMFILAVMTLYLQRKRGTTT